MNKHDNLEKIIQGCVENKNSAQKEFYQMYSKAMFNTCLRMLGNRHSAEDALQESFIKAFQNFENYRHDSTVGAWLKRITVNTCLNILKKRSIEFAELNDCSMPIEKENTKNVDFTVDRIKEAVNYLSNGYRTVFNLYAFEGYDHQEIGQLLNISESTSKSQYSRAKVKIRQILVNDNVLVK